MYPKTFEIVIDRELLQRSGPFNKPKICPITTFCKEKILSHCTNLTSSIEGIYTEGWERIHQVTYILKDKFTKAKYNRVMAGEVFTTTAIMDRDEAYANEYLKFKT